MKNETQKQEYMDRQREFIHPYISFLVNGMSDIRSIISDRIGATDAVYTLETFIVFLDPEIQKHMETEIKQLADWQNNTSSMKRPEVIAIVRKIMFELHTAGYFAGARIKTIEIGGEHPR